jgi:3-isopropylmalate/(R)-2-methylmalate dehydratase small subunit
MTPFTTLEGVGAPFVHDDIDTDAIIPVPWMKSTNPDYARSLFANWRWVDGAGKQELPDFVLNREPFRRAVILIGGKNFGCGSARDHAAWALQGFGIRCVVAIGFSDIFRGNALRSGLLPVVLPKASVDALERQLNAGIGDCQMRVDLPAQTVTGPDGAGYHFEIEERSKATLIAGLDEIGETLLDRASIDAFQRRDRLLRPWIYDPPLNAVAARVEGAR